MLNMSMCLRKDNYRAVRQPLMNLPTTRQTGKVKIEAYTKTVLTCICLVILAERLDAGFLTSTAYAQTENVVDPNKINNAVRALETLKTAVVDHYAKFGSFPIGDNAFESTLEREGLVAKPPSLMKRKVNSSSDYHVRVMNPLPSTALVTATNAAYNFEGSLTNQVAGSFVIETVIFDVTSQDARDLSLFYDGPKLSSPLGEADLRGRIKFAAIRTNGFGEVHVYFTHR